MALNLLLFCSLVCLFVYFTPNVITFINEAFIYLYCLVIINCFLALCFLFVPVKYVCVPLHFYFVLFVFCSPGKIICLHFLTENKQKPMLMPTSLPKKAARATNKRTKKREKKMKQFGTWQEWDVFAVV